jgi:hypothetical protein
MLVIISRKEVETIALIHIDQPLRFVHQGLRTSVSMR